MGPDEIYNAITNGTQNPGDTPVCADTSNNGLVKKLREMMERTDGKDKCTICNAIKELESKNAGGWDIWPFLLLIPLLSGGLANDSVEKAMRAYIEAIDNVKKDSKTEDS